MTSESWLEILGLAALFAGIVFAAWQVRLLRKQLFGTQDWNRRKAAQDAVGVFVRSGRDFEKLEQSFGFLDRKAEIPIKEIEERLKESPSLSVILVDYLNMLEWIAVGVNNCVFDEKVTKDALERRVENALLVFGAFIRERRDSYAPSLYSEFEGLANHWRTERTPARRRSTPEDES